LEHPKALPDPSGFSKPASAASAKTPVPIPKRAASADKSLARDGVLGKSQTPDPSSPFSASLADIAEFMRSQEVDMGIGKVSEDTWRLSFSAKSKKELNRALDRLVKRKGDFIADEPLSEVLEKSYHAPAVSGKDKEIKEIEDPPRKRTRSEPML
jgi:hypothetical protein